jgi:hypothetical protein
VPIIKRMPALRLLDVRRTKVSAAGVKAIARPGLAIERDAEAPAPPPPPAPTPLPPLFPP